MGRKWAARIAVSVLGLVAVLVLLYRVALPLYVDHAIRNALHERGFDDVSFSVESVSFSQLILRDLRLDQARTMSAGRVELDYKLSELMVGKVRELRLIDATWKIQLSEDYVASWGPMARLVKSDGARPPSLRRVRWLDSHLIVVTPASSFAASLGGRADFFLDAMQIELRGEVFDQEIYIRASTHSNKRIGLLSGEMLGKVAPPGQRNWLSLTLRFEKVADDFTLDLGIKGYLHSIADGSEARDWAFSNVRGRLKIQLQGEEVRQAHGVVSASSASLGQMQVLKPRVQVQRRAAALALELSAQVEKCSGRARGYVSPYPRQWLSSDSFDGEWQAAGMVPATLQNRLRQAGVVASGLRFELGARTLLRRDEKGWWAEFNDASALITAKVMSLPANRLVIRGPRASLHFDARIGAERAEIKIRSTSKASARSLRWRALLVNAAQRSSPALTLIVGEAPATIAWHKGSLTWRAGEVRARLGAALKYADTVRIRKLRGALTLAFRQRGTGLDAQILWSSLRANSLGLGKIELPNPSFRIRGRPNRLRIDASSKLTKSATLSIHTSVKRKGKRTSCLMGIELPPCLIKANDRLDTLIQQFSPLRIRGKVELRAHYDPCSPGSDSRAHLQLTNVRAEHIKSEIGLVGISSSLVLTGLNPIGAADWQVLRWTSTNVRKQRFGAGSIVLRSPRPDQVEIQRVKLDLGGGRLWTSAFTLDSKAPEIRTTIYARGVSLNRWLHVLSKGRVRGRGLFLGQVGMRLQWTPQLQLTVFSGRFRSDGRGHFTVNSRAWLRSVLERYAAGFDIGGEMSDLVKDRLIGALFDFDYSTFHAQIQSGVPQVLRIATKGKGRQIPQELDLTLNVTGLEELINPALRAWLANRE